MIQKDRLLSITKYIVEKYRINKPVKLQKIMYFLYLDYLKETKNIKFFEDEFEAWIFGPVVPKLFQYIKSFGFNFEREDGAELIEIEDLKDQDLISFIDENIIKYLELDSGELIEKSHLTNPWIKARKNLKKNDRSNNKILFEDLKDYANTKFNWQQLLSI